MPNESAQPAREAPRSHNPERSGLATFESIRSSISTPTPFSPSPAFRRHCFRSSMRRRISRLCDSSNSRFAPDCRSFTYAIAPHSPAKLLIHRVLPCSVQILRSGLIRPEIRRSRAIRALSDASARSGGSCRGDSRQRERASVVRFGRAASIPGPGKGFQ